MRILRAEIWACDDCCMWLCNADLSGCEYGQGEERVRQVQDACEAQGPHIAANFGSDDHEDAGMRDADGDACEICGYEDSRYLHRFAELGEGPEELDHDGAREFPIVNPSDHDRSYRTTLYRMWASDGAYCARKIYVWADGFETAFEHLAEWLDDNAPGYLARSSELLADMTDEERAEAEESGEIPDYTYVGHTTLRNGDCIASHCWGGDEITDEALLGAVRLLSA